MRAMILAAGEGTRMRDVTFGEIPKPMVDLGPGPLLEHTVNWVTGYGVEEIIINTSYRGEAIKNYFGGSWQGTPLHYSEEETLLGTAGGVKNVSGRFEDTFLVVYGDILTDLDIQDMVAYHRDHNADLTMLVYRENPANLAEASIVVTDADNRVTAFYEKPGKERVNQFSDADIWTNGSVFVMEPSILQYIPDGFADFSRDVFPRIVKSDQSFYAYPLPENVYWHEVGNPDRYKTAVDDVSQERIVFQGGE